MTGIHVSDIHFSDSGCFGIHLNNLVPLGKDLTEA